MRCGEIWELIWAVEGGNGRHYGSARRSDVRRREPARPVRELRQAAAYGLCPTVRPVGGSRGVSRDGAHVANGRPGRARFHLRAVRRAGVQPHRGPRAGRAEPAHPGAGAAVGTATPAGYLAVTGRWSEPWWLLPVGALAVTFWVGGFDVFYALPDEAFDRSERLESLVVRLGQARAILAAKLSHGLALVALVLFGIGAELGVAYYVGVAVGAALIAWEHRLVRPGDLSRLNAAFFTANGIVSIVVFLGALVDRVL